MEELVCAKSSASTRQQLQRRILEQDRSLDLPVEAERSGHSRRGILGIAITLVSLAVGFGIWSLWSGDVPPQPRADAAVELSDVSGRIERVVHLGRTPRALAHGAGALWSADFAGQTVTRVNLRTGRSTVTGVSAPPTTIAFGLSGVWVGSSFTRMLYRFDPGTGELTATIDLPDLADVVVTGGGRVWVVDQQSGTLVSVDPRTATVSRLASHLAGPSGIAADQGSLWIALSFARKLLRIDMRTLARSTYPLQLAPGNLAVGCGAVWLTDPADNEVTQFDLRSHRQQTIAVGDNPISVTADDRYAWVSNDLGHTTQKIDCIGHQVVQTITFGASATNSRGLSPTARATTPGGVWIALQRF